jgi:hypothetical protein
MQLELSREIFEKYSDIKFHENPSIGSRVPCGRTDGQTDRMTKLIVAFCNFAITPKNLKEISWAKARVLYCRKILGGGDENFEETVTCFLIVSVLYTHSPTDAVVMLRRVCATWN